MAKRIKNPKEVKIVEEDNQITVSLHYGVSCDEYPDLAIRKGLPIESLTPQEQNKVDQIMTWATGKIEEHEGIV